MASELIVDFRDPDATDHSLVGGKGANLGRLTAAGFPVPVGFTVVTAAYDTFLDATGLRTELASLLAGLDHSDQDALAARTNEIRELIRRTAMPARVAEEVGKAYEALGPDVFVAVRSSGTAEDLAEASFAGLHDTYLHIQGVEGVLDAVRRCWASLWTARATAYRSTKGFEHAEVGLAVVVQEMVDSQVAGVMFTGNPMTTATDEFVINASWGLGESVVSGVATPDQFVVKSRDSRIRDRILGAKQVHIVRDPGTGVGTVEVEVPAGDRDRYCLDDQQLATLADLGRRVMDHYDGFPQDIEWGYVDGSFHLLQSRPVTGVEFSWDHDCEQWQASPEDDDEIRTRQFADEAWTGAVTPLMYSWYAWAWQEGHNHAAVVWGLPELAEMRYWSFHKSEVYYSSAIEMIELEKLCLGPFRPMVTMDRLPPMLHEQAHSAPSSLAKWLWKYARIEMLTPKEGIYRWFKTLYDKHIVGLAAVADGLPAVDLRGLTDAGIVDYCQRMVEHEAMYFKDVWHAFFVYCRDVFPLFAHMLMRWYDGPQENVFIELMTGTRRRTATTIESHKLWQLAQMIRNSPRLRATFEENPGAGFFTELDATAEGRELAAAYQAFVAEHGHRGHEDRDVYFPRRADDPSIDYRSLQALLSGAEAPPDPEDVEAATNARREQALDEVLANVARKPLGALRVEAIKVVYGWCQEFLAARDDERHYVDRATYSIRRGYLEIGRRLRERGVFTSDRDVFFLSREELYEVFHGRANMKLVATKINARARDFDRFNEKEWTPPKFIKGYRPLEVESVSAESEDGVFRGIGTSRGTVTGTARVIKQLKDLGRLQQGEILVTHSTDPGWAAAFSVISGIVTETGGMLSHASCLAREYGLPGAQIEESTRRIPDGAIVRLNGGTGEVVVVEESIDDVVVPDGGRRP